MKVEEGDNMKSMRPFQNMEENVLSPKCILESFSSCHSVMGEKEYLLKI